MSYISRTHDIYFAGGCFWGVEKYFSSINGVVYTECGYANGEGMPVYEEVCNSNGFCECVLVRFDPGKISLMFLLHMFYKIIDPISINKQGNDIGIQYRSGIYFTKNIDAIIVSESLVQLQEQYDKPLAIEALPLKNYFRAEEYHQKYLDHHPGGYCHIPQHHFEEAKKAQCVLCSEEDELFCRKSQEELRYLLTPLQFEVTQNNATEAPFENAYWNHFEEGIYLDVTTGEPLFSSKNKLHSTCGWPSFSKPIHDTCIKTVSDQSHGMSRMEVRSVLGDAHLGHVFDDGPAASGDLRYCINSAALTFIPKDKMQEYGYKDYLYLFQEI